MVFFPRILYYKATNIINSYPGMENEIELHSRKLFLHSSFLFVTLDFKIENWVEIHNVHNFYLVLDSIQ